MTGRHRAVSAPFWAAMFGVLAVYATGVGLLVLLAWIAGAAL